MTHGLITKAAITALAVTLLSSVSALGATTVSGAIGSTTAGLGSLGSTDVRNVNSGPGLAGGGCTGAVHICAVNATYSLPISGGGWVPYYNANFLGITSEVSGLGGDGVPIPTGTTNLVRNDNAPKCYILVTRKCCTCSSAGFTNNCRRYGEPRVIAYLLL